MSINFTPTPANEHQRKANWDHKYRHQNMSVDMDVWYPFLKSITFKTYFIPLKYREAEAVLNFNFFKNKGKKEKFTKEDITILKSLEKKVDHYFETHEDLKNGAMFRLSGRSGKDMDYYDNKKIFALYEENLEKVAKEYGTDKTDINTKYVAITTLMNRFKVNNGKDVLNVLLTSERLFLDLKDWLNHGGREQMILRVWDDSLCSNREFRAFIQNNELKAICQDERFACFKNMVENKDLYEKLINEYFKKALQPLMKIPNYIADFCILKNNEVKLIEFSPFLRCTSACLFRWDLNYDEMLHGSGKLTIRDKVCENLEYFVNEWETYQSKPSDPFDNYFKEVDSDNKGVSIIDKTKNVFSNLFKKKSNNENNNKNEENTKKEEEKVESNDNTNNTNKEPKTFDMEKTKKFFSNLFKKKDNNENNNKIEENTKKEDEKVESNDNTNNTNKEPKKFDMEKTKKFFSNLFKKKDNNEESNKNEENTKKEDEKVESNDNNINSIEKETKRFDFDKTKKFFSNLFKKKDNNENNNKIEEITNKEDEKVESNDNNTITINKEPIKFENRKIFVVSVLKTGFFWSHKYITYDGSEDKVVGKGVLEDHTIYVDKNGFGWIMEKKGKKCYGEVIDVEYEDFLDVEFFYGQRDTTMQEITVKVDGEDVKVYAYIIKEIFDNVKSEESEEKCEIEEYTLEMQNEKFNSMQHIINQQERYLHMSLDFDLKDSW